MKLTLVWVVVGALSVGVAILGGLYMDTRAELRELRASSSGLPGGVAMQDRELYNRTEVLVERLSELDQRVAISDEHLQSVYWLVFTFEGLRSPGFVDSWCAAAARRELGVSMAEGNSASPYALDAAYVAPIICSIEE